jgi:hypothetical protein
MSLRRAAHLPRWAAHNPKPRSQEHRMRTKSGGVIALIETASVTAMLFLLRQEGLPPHIAVSLVFFLPTAFGLHVFEEFIFPGGASDWFKTYRPQYADAYTPSYFFKINALSLVASVLVCFGAFDYRGRFSSGGIRAWLAFVSLQGFNAVYHIRGAIESKQYSPGMVTGTILYLPLTILSFVYLLRTGAVDLVSAIVCILIGAVSQSVFDRIKERSMKRQRNDRP